MHINELYYIIQVECFYVKEVRNMEVPNSKKNLTIYDIAEKAGVSIATVSRAFSGKGYVSDATREKIMSICDGYRPNAAARNVQSSKSNTIGLLLSHGADYFLYIVLLSSKDFLRILLFLS